MLDDAVPSRFEVIWGTMDSFLKHLFCSVMFLDHWILLQWDQSRAIDPLGVAES